MRRTFNYTGRRKIALSRVDISVRESSDKKRTFDAQLDLSGLKFPDHARVFVEAYYDRALMRFDWGTVGSLRTPADRHLTELEFTDQANFRVKVVDDETGHGKILGLANGIRPKSLTEVLGKRESLLRVNAISGMGQEIWRLNFSELAGPVLELNREIPEVTSLVAHERRVSLLIYPVILREVLTRAIALERYDADDEAGGWMDKWMAFVRSFYPQEPPVYTTDQENWEECEDWIESAVAAFAKHISARERFVEALDEEKN